MLEEYILEVSLLLPNGRKLVETRKVNSIEVDLYRLPVWKGIRHKFYLMVQNVCIKLIENEDTREGEM